MEAKTTIHIVGTECPPEAEEKFDTWYSERHVPDVLKFKGVKRVTRYRKLSADGEYPKFLAVYEFNNRQDFEAYNTSPERTAAIEDWLKIQKELGSSIKWSVQYEVIKTWQENL